MNIYQKITSLFPLWALAAAIAAWFFPAPFAASKPAIMPLLGLIMLCMGMTLQPSDFLAALTRPGVIAAGVMAQYIFMPLSAWVISLALGLSPALTAGMVLVGASPGGTASNVICFLAGGDVALSITLTAFSTLLSVLATPLLTLLYAGATVPVPAASMILSIFKIVLLPVAAGVALNRLAGSSFVKRALPLVSVAAIVFIIAIVVALNRERIAVIGMTAGVAVILHNLSGLGAGYMAGLAAGWDRKTCRTLSIEVGMQNSGLAVALAMKYFGATAAIPGAVFSLWHNISGSLLASFWSGKDDESRTLERHFSQQ